MFKFNGREICDYELNLASGGFEDKCCDSFVEFATWASTGIDLSDTELDALNDDGDLIYEMVENAIY